MRLWAVLFEDDSVVLVPADNAFRAEDAEVVQARKTAGARVREIGRLKFYDISEEDYR